MDHDNRFFREDNSIFPDESERIEFRNNFFELLNLVKERIEVCEFLLTKNFPYTSYGILTDLANYILKKEF